MKRTDDPDQPSGDAELQQFEEQLRALKPRALKPRTLTPPDLTTEAPLLNARSNGRTPLPIFSGRLASRWAVAASLLLMWGVGAGMGAAAALAWAGFPGGARPAPAGEAVELATASSNPTPTNTDSSASTVSASAASIGAPVTTAIVAPPRPAGSALPLLITYPWRTVHDDQAGVPGTLSPLSAYRASHLPSDLSASPQRLLPEMLPPSPSLDTTAADRSPASSTTSTTDYRPTPGKSQRELLRGLLDFEAERIF